MGDKKLSRPVKVLGKETPESEGFTYCIDGEFVQYGTSSDGVAATTTGIIELPDGRVLNISVDTFIFTDTES